jgi:hypothetical protein
MNNLAFFQGLSVQSMLEYIMDLSKLADIITFVFSFTFWTLASSSAILYIFLFNHSISLKIEPNSERDTKIIY